MVLPFRNLRYLEGRGRKIKIKTKKNLKKENSNW
jgi:hypothetical protein